MTTTEANVLCTRAEKLGVGKFVAATKCGVRFYFPDETFTVLGCKRATKFINELVEDVVICKQPDSVPLTPAEVKWADELSVLRKHFVT